MQFNQQDMFQNSQTVSYFTKGNEKVTKHLKVNLRDPHFGLTKPHGRWYPQGNTVDTVLLWSLTFKCFRLVLYNLCAHRSRGHFFCLYQFAKQLHWRGSLSDKYDPLWGRTGYPKPTLQPSQDPCLCRSYAERKCVCAHDRLCIRVSYLDQIPNYTDECLFNAVLFIQIHKQTDINITQTRPLSHTKQEKETHAGQRQQALHFLFHPLFSSSAPLLFHSGLPNTQPTVTIATSHTED